MHVSGHHAILGGKVRCLPKLVLSAVWASAVDYHIVDFASEEWSNLFLRRHDVPLRCDIRPFAHPTGRLPQA